MTRPRDRQPIALPPAGKNHRRLRPSAKRRTGLPLLPLAAAPLPASKKHMRRISKRNHPGPLPGHPAALRTPKEKQRRKSPSRERPAHPRLLLHGAVRQPPQKNRSRKSPKRNLFGHRPCPLTGPLPVFSSRSFPMRLLRTPKLSCTALLWPISIIPWNCR